MDVTETAQVTTLQFNAQGGELDEQTMDNIHDCRKNTDTLVFGRGFRALQLRGHSANKYSRELGIINDFLVETMKSISTH